LKKARSPKHQKRRALEERQHEQFFPKVKGEHSRYNTFFLQDYNEYKPPEGFKGVIIIDDM